LIDEGPTRFQSDDHQANTDDGSDSDEMDQEISRLENMGIEEDEDDDTDNHDM